MFLFPTNADVLLTLLSPCEQTVSHAHYFLSVHPCVFDFHSLVILYICSFSARPTHSLWHEKTTAGSPVLAPTACRHTLSCRIPTVRLSVVCQINAKWCVSSPGSALSVCVTQWKRVLGVPMHAGIHVCVHICVEHCHLYIVNDSGDSKREILFLSSQLCICEVVPVQSGSKHCPAHDMTACGSLCSFVTAGLYSFKPAHVITLVCCVHTRVQLIREVVVSLWPDQLGVGAQQIETSELKERLQINVIAPNWVWWVQEKF